uniref:6-phosphogluconate dehydrogenase NADP-binding domain-containing protein n=1 Tax=Globisporangium ultimum (strain ATCC 200006 / CBS 805.95 / DAOM BR144) TaxID=431595 RepID=K3WKS0_GLOUD
MDATAKQDHRRRSVGAKKDDDDVTLVHDNGMDAIAAPTHAEVAESVAAMTSEALQGLHGHHSAAAYSALLADRKRESDSDIHDDEENEDENEDDDDPTRMIPLADDDTALVQCAGMEQSYESWEDFHRAMDEYCIATHQPMRLRTSDSAKAVNGRAAKRNSLKEPIDESVGFVKKLYLCTHGVKTKPRGKGKRPRQHYRYMGCPAMIRACISERKPGEGHGKNKYVVRVVAQINKHNHRLSEHLFKSYSESRVVIDEELVVPGSHRMKDESDMTSPTGVVVPPSVDHLSTPAAHTLEDHALKTTPIFQAQALDIMGASRMKLRVGWIGTGIMGNSMCGHILSQGYEVTVYNRSPGKCQALREKGAVVVNSPAEVARYSDIVFVIVGYPSDVKSVIMDPQTGLLSRMKVGGVIVDMTTSEPSLAKEIYEAAKEKGVSTLDAPVSGGDIGAREATLSIMVGGDVDAVYAAMPYFNMMGKNIRHMGGPGAGQHTKMVNQILISTNMIGVCEGLLYAKRAGLDMHEAIRAVSAGAAGSWSISNMGPRIAKRNFDPGFFVEHFLKDMGIALKEAERMNLSLPGLALANQLYIAVKAQGHGRLGTQSLMLGLEHLNGIFPEKPKDVEIV